MRLGTRPLALVAVTTLLGAAPAGAGAQSLGVERATAPAAAVAPVPMPAHAANEIARRWGIRIESMRLTAAGYMLDFRYRVIDARKARPIFARRTKPRLVDEATGAVLLVPTPPKTGALRNSNDPKAGRSYFMFFANPGRLIAEGQTVTVTIGEFSVSGISVAS